MEIFKLFNPEWAVVSPDKITKIQSISTSCIKCIALNTTLQEKYTVLFNLINESKDLQKQLDDYKEKDEIKELEIEKLKESQRELSEMLEDYDALMNDLRIERDDHKDAHEITSRHLAILEESFADLHIKYERAKAVVTGYKQNEILIMEAVKKNEETILCLQNRYEQLKEHTTVKLEDANETLEKLKQNYEFDLSRLRTKIKKLELTVNTLEQSLQQKIIENQKLSSICDEFIKEKN